MKDQVGVVIQARLGSERLPGKILLQASGKPLLEHLLERLNGLPVVIATTPLEKDQPIVALAKQLSVPFFCGSEQDVLDRSYQAAKKEKFKTVIRITSDCPLIDKELIDQCINLFKEKKVDYLSNTLERSYPRGMDVEIFTIEALEAAWKEAKDVYDREHVTPFIRRHPDRFKQFSVVQKDDLSHLRLTLDTPEDYKLIKAIYEELYPQDKKFGLNEILRVLKRHPDWVDWNRHVKQKS